MGHPPFENFSGMEIFFVVGSCGVFQGILLKRGVLRWFFDGENVVECVVNVVFWQSLFRGEKMRQIFEIYFRVPPVLGVSAVGVIAFSKAVVREGALVEAFEEFGYVLVDLDAARRREVPDCSGFGDGCDGDFHAGDADQ
jgi:hypothetical protein